MEQPSPAAGWLPPQGVLTHLPPSVLRVASPTSPGQKGSVLATLGDRPATSQALCRPTPFAITTQQDSRVQASPGSPRSPTRNSSLHGPLSPSHQRPGTTPSTPGVSRLPRAVSLRVSGTAAAASPLSATSPAETQQASQPSSQSGLAGAEDASQLSIRPSTATSVPSSLLAQAANGSEASVAPDKTAPIANGDGESGVSTRASRIMHAMQEGVHVDVTTPTHTRPTTTSTATTSPQQQQQPVAVPEHVAAMQAAAGLRRPFTVADPSAGRLRRSADPPSLTATSTEPATSGRFQRHASRPISGGTREGSQPLDNSTISSSRTSTPMSRIQDMLNRSRPATTNTHTRPSSKQDVTRLMGLTRNQDSPGLFQDLFEATNKSFAAAMGEWHLQPLDVCNTTFKQRMFQGPIGPEQLKCQFGLSEPDILKLYRVLYLYSVGFCAAVLEPTERARDRERLLEAVFKAFSQLWDEALGISFQSEIVNVLHTKMDAVTAMDLMSTQLTAMQEEHSELQERLQQFVKRNIDNMLAYRLIKEKASTCEGEATMLSATNDALAVKLAGSQLAREELILAARTAADKQRAAEEHAATLEVTLARAKAAVKEQQQLVARHVAQNKKLEESLEASRLEREELKAKHDQHLADLDNLRSKVSQLEGEAHDKDKAYALLHSNWLVKDRDLATLRQQNTRLEATVEDMKETHATARKQIKEAKDSEQAYRQKWELSCEQVQQVTETNKKLATRNAELIRSYWPLVSRLREAEEQHALMKQTSEEAVSRKDALVVEVERLQRLLDVAETDAARLQAIEKEVETDTFQVSERDMEGLPSDLRRKVAGFFRGAKKRVAELTQQLVQLVDVQAASAYQLQQSQAARKELQMKVAVLEQQVVDTTQTFTRKLARAAAKSMTTHNTQAGGGVDLSQTNVAPASSADEAAAALELATLKVELQEAREALTVSNSKTSEARSQVAQLTAEMDALKVGSASRDRWILEAASQAQVFATKVDLLLLQDPSRANPVPPAPGSSGSPGGAPGAQQAPEAVQDSAGVDGAEQDGQAGHGTADDAASQEGDSDNQQPRLLQGIATGRIAASLKQPGETRASLVTLDHSWEQLATSLESLLEWSQEVMSKKALISRLSDFQDEAASAASRAADAESKLASIQQQLDEAQEYRASIDKVVAETAASLQVAVQRAEAATAAEAASAADAQACRQELSQLHEKHVLMEEEYWVVKARLLEAQLAEAGLKAEHYQALQEATRAVEARKQAEFEAAEQRGIRQQLESEIVGLKAWIRTMQRVEVAYKELLMDHNSLKEDLLSSKSAAACLQEQVDGLTSRGTAAVLPTSTGALQVELERLRAVSSQAAEQARACETAKMEMQALLAEARRAAEAASDALRFCQSEVERLSIREQKALTEAAHDKERAERLTRQLLNMQLVATQHQAERGQALGALIDARMQAAVMTTTEPQVAPVDTQTTIPVS